MLIGSVMSNLGVGVVSGLVTGLIILFSSVYWRGVVVPWWDARMYRGVSIAGTWTLKDEKREDFTLAQAETLELSQTAHRLRGTVTLTPKDQTTGPVTSQVAVGYIEDRFVTLTMTSPVRNKLSHGVILAQIVGSGARLEGQSAFYDVNSNEITSISVVYERHG